MCPLLKELEARPGIESLCCVTGQHSELLHEVLDEFGIAPDVDLAIMSERQSLSEITSRCLRGLDSVLDELCPDMLLVQGDTSTAFSAALSAFYHKIPIGYVEAGLRTDDLFSPYPEEMNRQLISRIADILFCPTEGNRENLLREGVRGKILVTGNTVIDALRRFSPDEHSFACGELNRLDRFGKKLILLTCHRRENLGAPMESVMRAVRRLAFEHEDVEIVFPVHPSPSVRLCAEAALSGVERVHLLPPLSVGDMHALTARSYLVMTDSGGLQEEAPAFGKPVVILRSETERPEAIEAGAALLAGTEEEAVYSAVHRLLTDSAAYSAMAQSVCPFGDGLASGRIADALEEYFGLR